MQGRAVAKPPILPPLRRFASDAWQFARAAHAGQVDKAGNPYIGHVAGVAERLARMALEVPSWGAIERDEAEQVAWLHDVIEDTEYGAPDLVGEGFSGGVVLGVLGLTKPPMPVGYADWIGMLGRYGDLAMVLVKLADVRDNADPRRLAVLEPEVRERLQRKYGPAEDALVEAAVCLGWRPTAVQGARVIEARQRA